MGALGTRLAARIGVCALAVGAGLALPAVARAEPGVDLVLTMVSGKVAEGSAGKPFMAKVTNAGDTTAEGFELTVDLDYARLEVVDIAVPAALDDFCATVENKIRCEFGNVLVRGDSLEIPILVTPKPPDPNHGGPAGYGGALYVEIRSDQDPGPSGNNFFAPELYVSGAGADIVVWAEDVVAARDKDTGEAQRVAPGSEADLYFGLANYGSLTAAGIEFQLTLPDHVTFVTGVDGCDPAPGNRILACSGPTVQLPADYYFEWKVKVKVAADAPGPVELTGSMEGRALGVESDVKTLARAKAAAEVPGWAVAAQADFDPTEIDVYDNTDAFAVLVGAATGGGGGDGGTGGGTGGGDGGLPVTGTATTITAVAGGVLLIAGAAVFLAFRRRRVVLVTPSE